MKDPNLKLNNLITAVCIGLACILPASAQVNFVETFESPVIGVPNSYIPAINQLPAPQPGPAAFENAGWQVTQPPPTPGPVAAVKGRAGKANSFSCLGFLLYTVRTPLRGARIVNYGCILM